MNKRIIITVTVVAMVFLLYYSHKDELVSCATEYFQYKQSKTEYFSIRYKELYSVYSSYHVDKIGFIQGDQFNVEDASDSIIYVTHSDKMVDLLNTSGKVGVWLPQSAYPYVIDEQSDFLLCKIVAIDEKEDDLNVYRLHKMEE
ncbi:MAG: hypothetical protein IKK62_05695 [Bacteroidaceae bacterium]|nr:hypothetical protein [Bacteroidaceae bacterium]